jgi:hypothetical protein
MLLQRMTSLKVFPSLPGQALYQTSGRSTSLGFAMASNHFGSKGISCTIPRYTQIRRDLTQTDFFHGTYNIQIWYQRTREGTLLVLGEGTLVNALAKICYKGLTTTDWVQAMSWYPRSGCYNVHFYRFDFGRLRYLKGSRRTRKRHRAAGGIYHRPAQVRFSLLLVLLHKFKCPLSVSLNHSSVR